MSLRRETPCDFGECPYAAEYHSTCEYYCGAEEPQDDPEIWEDEDCYSYEELRETVDDAFYSSRGI